MILHLVASSFYGGPERQVYYHLKYARKRGIDIHVGVFSGKGMDTTLAVRAKDLPQPVHLVHTDRKMDLASFRQLANIVKQNGIQFICCHGVKSTFYSFLLAKSLPVTISAFFRGYTTEDFKVRLYSRLFQVIAPRFDYIVALSTVQKTELLRIGVAENKIVVINNTIDFRETEEAATIAYGDLAIPDIGDRAYIAAIGRLSPEKGHADLIEAMSFVRQRHADIRLVIFGEGPERVRLERQVAERGLSDSVLLPGFSRYPAFYIKRALLLVNPSHSEGMPNVILEGRVLQTPIVATDVGAVSEILEHDDGGVLVPPRDPQALAHGIERLLGNRELLAELRARSNQEFKARFSPEKQTELYLQFYRRALGGQLYDV